ncbi:MAG: hypothetical protein COA78_37720 [Blastopirellula sp.]|nr:MAG: hypothetical protein COA78_37720 [Blastopirellula sp.]
MSDLARVEDLAQRVADGLANEAMIAELEALMREDESARITYLQTLQLHQDLERKAARGTLSDDPVLVELPRDFRKSPSHSWGPALAMTGSLLAAVVVWVWLAGQGGDAEINEPHIATITRLDQVDKPLAYHQPFEPGDRIAFNTGFVELTYRNGTRLVLQGPVNYTLEDADRGRLELGSLAAEVPPGASGFTVVTPSAEVKDIGTRFAVVLLDTGRTEFEVFEGEVRARSTAGSVSKSFKKGETAAVDDGATDVQSISTNLIRFRGVYDALNQHTVNAVADRFVQGGKHVDLVPIDGQDVLMLKQLGANNDVARKVWICFDLSEQSVDLDRPATLTLHTAKDLKRESWDVQLYGLKSGFKPGKGIQNIDWREETLTWNNAPGNDAGSPVQMNNAAALITSGEIRVDPENEPAGSFFTFTIPSLKPFMQEDGTVTLMLSTATGRHKVLLLSAREHETFAGPLLSFETQKQNIN